VIARATAARVVAPISMPTVSWEIGATPSTLGFACGLIRKPTSNPSVRGGNCLIACSGEIDCNGTAVRGEDRQSPVIEAKTCTHCEFNAHVFHRATFYLPIVLHRYDLPTIEALERR
jgi:hypothetical protein